VVQFFPVKALIVYSFKYIGAKRPKALEFPEKLNFSVMIVIKKAERAVIF
tara:strand:- start:930 stop:1079 length:150 start_codon:yes stop_codon:yes gene_type:complete